MRTKIDIVILVDVIGALSGGTLLDGNLCMVDNSIGESTGQGTPELSTACWPGQLIEWTVRAVDLQTPVVIKSITFSSGAPPIDDEDPELRVWSGIVPPYMTPGTTYRYKLELQMYEGENSVMSIDTPSLRYATAR